MKILVLGGTRFIGRAAVAQLCSLGHEVRVFNRGKAPSSLPEGVARITGDLADLDAARPEFEAFAPEVVLHAVVISDADAENLVRVFKGITSRTVMLSSMDVYRAYGRVTGSEPGEPLPVPVDEDGALRENWYPYRERFPDKDSRMHDYDKIPAERTVLGESDLPGTVLRLPMVLGPHDYQHRLYGHIKPMLDERPAIVLERAWAGWRSTYGYVENVAAAIALACTDERAATRTYNVGDHALSTLALGEAVARELSWKGEFVLAAQGDLPESLHPGMATDQDLVCSTERIQKELDFVAPVDLEEAIHRTVDWEKEHPPDPLPEGLLNYDAEDAFLKEQ